jgi:holo-[acyl-carrier protein] synthase
VERAARSESFRRRVFSPGELAAKGGSGASLAGLFAAKEAVAKALGTGFSGFSPRDIEIIWDENSRPGVKTHGAAACRLGAGRVSVSISHCRCHAAAFAVIEVSAAE